MNVPGWAGSPDVKMANGSEPQPWHCLPMAEATTYGLELIYQYETECHVVIENGKTRIIWDYAKEPGGVMGWDEFTLTPPSPARSYIFATSVDVQAPPGYVIRTVPHPRFFYETSGTVPISLIGHVQTDWWPKKLFVVFKCPEPGQRHIFRKGEPYVQLLCVPHRMKYEAVPMAPQVAAHRNALEEAIKLGKSHIAKNVWYNPTGSEFNDHYKVLARVHSREGGAGVETAIRAAAEHHQRSLPKGLTIQQYLDLAQRYQDQGKFIEAKDVLMHVRSLDLKNAQAMSRFGILAAMMNLPDLALHWMNQATQAAPLDPANHKNLGEMLRRAGRLKEAEASLRKSLQLKPIDSDVLCNLAFVLAQQGRTAEGLQVCRNALKNSPSVPMLHFTMGLIHEGIKQYKPARAAYNAALAIDPKNAQAAERLAGLPAQAD